MPGVLLWIKKEGTSDEWIPAVGDADGKLKIASDADIERLADGQLPDTTGDLYTAPAGTRVYVSTIILVNTHSSSVNMNLFLLPSGGNARKLTPPDMPFSSKYKAVIDDGIAMNAGDKIRGDASVADKVDYVISGVTQT